MDPRLKDAESRLKDLLDYNGDGKFTISDVWLYLEWAWAVLLFVFFPPGNAIIYLFFTYAPGFVEFFELRPAWVYYFGWIAGILSWLSWVFLFYLIGGMRNLALEMDDCTKICAARDVTKGS